MRLFRHLLKAIHNNHQKPQDIDSEIPASSKWTEHLKAWNDQLVSRHMDYSANAYRSMHRLIEWLKGPGHAVIDRGVLEDTDEQSFQDAIDFAMAVLHWGLVIEALMPLKPGVEHLQTVFSDSTSMSNQCFFQYFDSGTKPANKALHTGLKIGYVGALKMLGLRDFVSQGTKRSRAELARDIERRRNEMIRNLNAIELLPYKVKAPNLPPLPAFNKGLIGVAALALLDLGDKVTTYIVDKNIHIPEKFGLNWLRRLEAWSDTKCPRTAEAVSASFSYLLKGAALYLSYLNLTATINAARFDYQSQKTTGDWESEWLSNTSAALIATQDLLAELGVLTGWLGNSRWVQTRLPSMGPWLLNRAAPALRGVFPQIVTTGGTGWEAVRVSGAWATGWAWLNVASMFILGVVTLVSMYIKAWDAHDNGDSTAIAFYGFGAVGGVVMAGGALILGIALMKGSGFMIGSVAGATVGVVMFVVGGVIAAIGAIGGWLTSTKDEFVLFARRCFLGKERTDGWGSEPPSWTAAQPGASAWTIAQQKIALHNLIGRFTLRTKPLSTFDRGKVYNGWIEFEIRPGHLVPKSEFEVALHYEANGSQDVVTFQIPYYDPAGFTTGRARLMPDQRAARVYYVENKGQMTKMIIRTKVSYNGNRGSLITTVTLRYPNLSNTISARKLVMEEGLLWGENVSEDTEISKIFPVV